MCTGYTYHPGAFDLTRFTALAYSYGGTIAAYHKRLEVTSGKGIIALMGSGELTSTMVEVHKDMLSRVRSAPNAVFLDTPAGFQLNADQLSEKAVDYFRTKVSHPLSVVSYKSCETISPYEAEQAFHGLRAADYVLIGPGSPTYAVRQWRQTPIPDILAGRIADGGCLVAASAAALTVGRFTLPVYEIYKVGESLHWIEGIDILGRFGMQLVVIPHWNNAEGGTHDTRFCYMGEPRFRLLAAQLPEEVSVLGLDEHTACLIDLQKDEFTIRGIGSVTVSKNGREKTFETGNHYPLSLLRDGLQEAGWQQSSPVQSVPAGTADDSADNSFWMKVHELQAHYAQAIDHNRPEKAINALLELDGTIWKAQEELETQEFISQARDILRDMIVLLVTHLTDSPERIAACLDPLVDEMVSLRNRFRQENKWEEADAIRAGLSKARIAIEDTREGTRWHYQPSAKAAGVVGHKYEE